MGFVLRAASPRGGSREWIGVRAELGVAPGVLVGMDPYLPPGAPCELERASDSWSESSQVSLAALVALVAFLVLGAALAAVAINALAVAALS